MVEQESVDKDSFHFLKALAVDSASWELPIPEDPHLSSLAVEHRMQGLVMTAIESRSDDRSNKLRTELTMPDAQTWARHQFLSAELSRVTSTLTADGIEHYLIKGLAVETRFYDRTGERPTADLDIVVVDPSSLRHALMALGDVSHDADVVQSLVDEGWIQSVDFILPSGALVDLHVDPLKLGFQTVFSSQVRGHLDLLDIDKAKVPTLDPAASLVVALLHLNRNRFRHLSGYADVAHILTRADVDWEAFDGLVKADGLEVLIEGSVHAVRQALGLHAFDFGGWAQIKVSDMAPRRLIWNYAWRPSTRLAGTAGRFRMGRRSQFLMPALCRGRGLWVVHWMWRRLLPPSAVVELNHPDAKGPYLVRLGRGRWNEMRHSHLHRRSHSNSRESDRS